MKRILQVLTVWMATQGTDLLACSVCGAGENDPTRTAYTSSTAFLSFVPLLAMGGVVYTIYRYVKKSDEQNDPQ